MQYHYLLKTRIHFCCKHKGGFWSIWLTACSLSREHWVWTGTERGCAHLSFPQRCKERAKCGCWQQEPAGGGRRREKGLESPICLAQVGHQAGSCLPSVWEGMKKAQGRGMELAGKTNVRNQRLSGECGIDRKVRHGAWGGDSGTLLVERGEERTGVTHAM